MATTRFMAKHAVLVSSTPPCLPSHGEGSSSLLADLVESPVAANKSSGSCRWRSSLYSPARVSPTSS